MALDIFYQMSRANVLWSLFSKNSEFLNDFNFSLVSLEHIVYSKPPFLREDTHFMFFNLLKRLHVQ